MFYSQRKTAPLAPCAPDYSARNKRSPAQPKQPRATPPAQSVELSFFFSLESKSNGCLLRSGSLLQLRGPVCEQGDGCGFGAVGGEDGEMLAVRAWCRWEAPSSRHYTDSAAFSYNPSFNRAVKRNVERVNSSLGRVHFRNPLAALLVSRSPFCWLRSCGVPFELAVERCFANP